MSISWTTKSPFPKKRLRGAKAKGIAFERRLAKLLAPEATKGGFQFRDHEWFMSPVGWRQPDFIFEREDKLIILEAKLTFTPSAFNQLAAYIGWLSPHYPSILGAVVCRNLTPLSPAPVASFSDLYPYCVWHLWI